MKTLPAVLAALLLPAAAAAQPFTTTIAEINPIQSTLDATDADGASGGRVHHVAAAADGSAFYAASEWGGLYKSVDDGQTWTRLDGHQPMAAWDVAVDPTDADHVYATSFYDGRLDPRSGINVSTDGGQTWTRPATATPPAGFCAAAARRDEPTAFGLSIDPDDPRTVYAGTNCGLAVSSDRGATWTFVDPTPGDGADDVWDVIAHDGVIDLCGDDGHRRSTDGGATWSTATAPLPGGRCDLAVSPDESYVLFAVVGTSIFESDDGGDTWPTALTNPRAQGRIPFVATNQRSGSGFDLWFGDVQLHRAACTTPASPAPGGAARCPVNTWTGPFTRSAGGHDDTGDLVFDPGATTDACPLLLSSDGGVYVNTSTTSPACHSPTWEQPAQTPRALWLFGMAGAAQPGNEDLYFGNQDNGTFAALDAASSLPTWTNGMCCDGFGMAAEPDRSVHTLCCFGGRANRLFVRGRGLAGGAELNTYPAGNLRGFRPVPSVAAFADDAYVLVTSAGVFVTSDISATPAVAWTQLGAGTSPASPQGVRVSDAGGTPVFYVQAGQGDGRSMDALWRYDGTGAGGTWQAVAPPGGVGGFGVFGVDPRDADRLMASHLRPGMDPQMLLSDDGGATWTNLPALDALMTDGYRYRTTRGPTNFTGFGGYVQPTLAAFHPEDARVLVAGAADAGVFVSIDGGTSWRLVTDPEGTDPAVPHVPRPWFVHFEPLPGTLFGDRTNIYLGTQGRGVWRMRLAMPYVLPPPVAECLRAPARCLPEMGPGVIELDCVRDPGSCAVLDPIPRNCLVKFDCPGCGPEGLCPPFYHFVFDALDLDVWDVTVLTREGEPVPHDLVRTGKGGVVSFRPSEKHYREREIGDYYLAFMPLREVRAAVEVPVRLEVSDGPYDGVPRRDGRRTR